MMTEPEALGRAAEALVGAPYRLHGRSAQTGLDCVGVIEAALRACGREVIFPATYGLRNSAIDRFIPFAAAAGFAVSDEPPAAGDVVMVRPGPGQWHLLLQVHADHFVHAHAALRKIVRQPAPLPWPIVTRWRLTPLT